MEMIGVKAIEDFLIKNMLRCYLLGFMWVDTPILLFLGRSLKRIFHAIRGIDDFLTKNMLRCDLLCFAWVDSSVLLFLGMSFKSYQTCCTQLHYPLLCCMIGFVYSTGMNCMVVFCYWLHKLFIRNFNDNKISMLPFCPCTITLPFQVFIHTGT